MSTIGIPAADKMAAEFGSLTLTVPLAENSDDIISRAKHRRRIAELRDEGHSHTQIARMMQCHLRTVERVLSGQRDERQMEMLV